MKQQRQKLSAAALPTLPPGDYTDHILPGLNLTVGARRRTWTMRHRVNGRQRRDTLGHYPVMGLADAREAARRLAEHVESGAQVEPPPVHPRSAALTLGGLVDRYETYRRAKGGHGSKSLTDAMRHVRRCLKDYLSMPAAAFGKNELRAARDAVARTAPVSSNRFVAYLGPILGWAEREDIIPTNFSNAIIRVGAETKRERVLTREEIGRVWYACDRLGPTPASLSYGRLIRFLLVTGQRRDEAAGMRFGQILDSVWRQGTDNKSGRAHSIPLPGLALDIVGSGEARALVFPGGAGTKLSGWSKFKRRLDKVSGVSNWTVHDLRRTAASGWQDGGADFLTIETLLNHSLKGVSGVYMRGEMQRQKAEALEAWAAELGAQRRHSARVMSQDARILAQVGLTAQAIADVLRDGPSPQFSRMLAEMLAPSPGKRPLYRLVLKYAQSNRPAVVSDDALGAAMIAATESLPHGHKKGAKADIADEARVSVRKAEAAMKRELELRELFAFTTKNAKK